MSWRVEWVFDCSSPVVLTTSPSHPIPASTTPADSSTLNPLSSSSSPGLQTNPKQQQQESSSFPEVSKAACQGATADVLVVDERVAENLILKEVLRRHLTYTPGAGGVLLQLRDFIDAGVDACCVLMKKERTPVSWGAI